MSLLLRLPEKLITPKPPWTVTLQTIRRCVYWRNELIALRYRLYPVCLQGSLSNISRY